MLFFYAAFITNYAPKMYQLCSYYAPKKWVWEGKFNVEIILEPKKKARLTAPTW